MIVKVADFGLSVNIGAKEYYRLTKHVDVKLPVKWMAPESLADYMFSEMSDVVNDNRVLSFLLFTHRLQPFPKSSRDIDHTHWTRLSLIKTAPTPHPK